MYLMSDVSMCNQLLVVHLCRPMLGFGCSCEWEQFGIRCAANPSQN
jgi:hypothetical protein